MDTAAKVARGVAALYLANILTFLFNSIFLVVLTNYYFSTDAATAASRVGEFALLNVFVVSVATLGVLALPLTGAGVSATPPAVTRFLTGTEESEGASAQTILSISLSICGLVSVLVIAATALGGGGSIFWAATDAAAFSFVQLGGYSLLGAHRATLAGKVLVASNALRYAFATVFLLGGYGVSGAFAGFALGDTCVALYANFESFRHVNLMEPTAGPIRPVLGYMASVFVAALVGLGVSQTDKLLAFFQRGLGDLALYNVATVGAAIAAFAPAAATNVLVPALSSFGTEESSVRETMKSYTRYVSHISFPIGFGIAAISPELLRIFGDAFVPAAPLMAIIAVSIALTAIGSVYTSSLLAYDKAHHYTISSMIGLAALIVVALATVPIFSLIGIALGRASMLVVVLASQAYYVFKSGRFTLDAGAYLRSLAASAAMGGLDVLIMAAILYFGALGRLAVVFSSLVVFVFGLAAYLVMMKYLGGFNESDIVFIEALIPPRLAWIGEVARRFI